MGGGSGAAVFVLLLGLFGISRLVGSVFELLAVCPECAPTLALLAWTGLSLGASALFIRWIAR